MPTLLERVGDLRERIVELGRVDVERANFEKLSTRASQVRARAGQIEAVVASIARLEAHGVDLGKIPKPSRDLRDKPAALLAALKSDWATFAKDSLFATSFLNPVEAHTEKIREVAIAAWRAHVDRTVPKINDGLLETLGKAGFASQVARLRDRREMARKLRDGLPASDDVFSMLTALAQEISAVWGQLEGVPSSVIVFLTKAARREATFQDLTSEVREWLGEHGMIPQLRIGIG